LGAQTNRLTATANTIANACCCGSCSGGRPSRAKASLVPRRHTPTLIDQVGRLSPDCVAQPLVGR